MASSSAVQYLGDSTGWKRRYLSPGSFQVDPKAVRGQRVILVEDTWVTGSTALSAAIAVRRAGAAGLALIPIARMVYESWMTDAYREAAAPPWDPERFPRNQAEV